MKYIMRKLNSIWGTPKFETKVVETESIIQAERENKGWVVYKVLSVLSSKKGRRIKK